MSAAPIVDAGDLGAVRITQSTTPIDERIRKDVLGLAASLMTNRLLVTQLWQTSVHDPVTFASVAGVIVMIALLACWVPARRAVRVEPMAALRHE